MSERPQIESIGTIVNVREPNRLYDIKMENGYVAIAVVPKDGPICPKEEAVGSKVRVQFSPYDMSRSKVLAWT